ncbi:hypothetical protein [Pseudomonas sp. P1.31]|jgi:hypothetical protein|uniref:alginate O-acetyltransferase AlgX-related protein n=1 Tax=Pseudomonas sp. P1.31 TaxID=1699311 RepID=UPI00069F9986|nr:hypothetical protein [Pseudomonas sp. P1.31]
MKRNVMVFIFLVLAVLIAIPAKNIITAPHNQDFNWRDKAFLYNMDFASRWAATVLYPLGISTDPQQVIIGRNGWLFLGDMYVNTLSDDRTPATDADRLTAKNIEAATVAWNAYLSDHGVKIYRVIIGPNKGTLYPENMPKWAAPVTPNPTDALLEADSGRFYVDLRPALREAKQTARGDLYFKTDTHWNAIGGGLAFKEFARHVAQEVPELQWPSDSLYDVTKTTSRKGGDLSSFLRMSSHLDDVAPALRLFDLPISITQVDFNTGRILSTGPNELIDYSMTPLLVKSSSALNNKKVLWLRDSFGGGMSQLMAATFSEVMQLHWSEALKPGGSFAKLVDEWQPDYVFVTVVERSARTEVFTLPPPPSFVKKDSGFQANVTATPIVVNHLTPGASDTNYTISGDDAFIDFALSSPATAASAQYLNVDFSCSDGAPSVPVQIFWLAEGMNSYDEPHSARLQLRTGEYMLNLLTVPKWVEATSVRSVRIDIDPDASCHQFQMSNPVLGNRTQY